MDLLDLFVKIGVQDEASDKVPGIGSKIKSGLATAGKVAAAGIGLITTAASAAIGGLLALEQSTEEYRIAQGKLNTAFESAGYSADTAQEAYRGFYEILGDTDTATEASQLLAKLAQSEEDVAKWTEIAAGVNGTFGDSLPIEGLIEASNETAKVGTVTGVLADALNWAGISEDEFNEKLSLCTDESERNQLIMETLSGTYDEAADAFYRNNDAIISARNNQVALDNAMAELGGTVADVKNRLLGEFVPALSDVAEAASGMISGVEGSEEQFSIAIQSLVDTAVSKLPDFLNVGTRILSAIASGIVQSIPTIVSAIPQIISQIGTAISGLFPQVLEMGTQLLGQLATGIEAGLPDMLARIPRIITEFLNYITTALPSILDKGVEIINSLVSGIISAIPQFVAGLPGIIKSFVGFVTENLPQIISAGITLLKNLAVGIVRAIPELVRSLPQIIVAIVEGIGALLGSIIEVGKDIIRGIWQGIQSMASWIWGKVKGFFSGIVNGVKKFLGIHSPSTVFSDMGKNMALGLGEGWDKQYSAVQKKIQDGLGTLSADSSISVGMASTGFNGGIGGENFMRSSGGITVIQNIYSEVKTAADLMREARHAQERAVLLGV